jgi:hypothetical protein
MRKVTLITVAVALISGCFGLFLLLHLGLAALKNHYPKDYPVPEFTWFCLSHRAWLLAAPVPFVTWLALALRKGTPDSDCAGLFAAVAALYFVALGFMVAIALVLPWAAIIDFLGHTKPT